MTEKCFDANSCVAPKLGARIAKLEDALRKMRPLLQDTVDVHSDPSDGGYNECDTAPCDWCETAKEVLEKP